jgi:hypothetical protein
MSGRVNGHQVRPDRSVRVRTYISQSCHVTIVFASSIVRQGVTLTAEVELEVRPGSLSPICEEQDVGGPSALPDKS